MEGMDKRTNAYKTRLKLVQELTERQSETLEAQERNIATIMPEALNKYIDITTQQVGIANEAKSIYNRADLSNANKRKRLDILQREFARLGQIRNIFKNDFQNDFVLESNKIKNKYTDLAKAKLTAKGITDKKQIDKEAQKIYTKDKLKETNEQAYNSAKKLANPFLEKEARNVACVCVTSRAGSPSVPAATPRAPPGCICTLGPAGTCAVTSLGSLH